MSNANTLAHRLAAYAHQLRFENLPREVVHEAKRVMIDSLGVALGAFHEEPVRAVRELACQFSARQGATVLGTRHRAPPDWAAFANGYHVRYFDFNDTYLSKEPAHPSDNIPAVLAAGESAGAGGKQLIEAIVIAYEVQCRFCDAVSIRARGWDHVTYGAFSTALGAARIFGLDPEKLRQAVNIAGVASAALRQSRVGELSHWKGCAFANAARHGVYAAMLARAGITGPAPIFEGEKGFERLVSQAPMKVAGPFADPPQPQRSADDYMIRQTCIKYYPAEYHAQSAVHLALQLKKKLGITDGSEIESILVESHDAAVDIIGSEPEKWRPDSRETADHSLPYMVAAALVDGELTDRQFEPARFKDEKLLSVVAKVTVQRHEELSALYPGAVGNIVMIAMKDGRVETMRLDHPPGHAKNRLSDDQLLQKYHSLADPIVGRERSSQLSDWIWNLERQTDLGSLFSLIAMD
ncbi:MAG: MmgE/PrpD family protein [Phycisphaerae bacterium]|nr:MmgE/PrpD family protein [Phycisphaerae bacterium]MDW8261522.1 MmgE/PrpD family protein [Phycisphaerales bacterium]